MRIWYRLFASWFFLLNKYITDDRKIIFTFGDQDEQKYNYLQKRKSYHFGFCSRQKSLYTNSPADWTHWLAVKSENSYTFKYQQKCYQSKSYGEILYRNLSPNRPTSTNFKVLQLSLERCPRVKQERQNGRNDQIMSLISVRNSRAVISYTVSLNL